MLSGVASMLTLRGLLYKHFGQRTNALVSAAGTLGLVAAAFVIQAWLAPWLVGARFISFFPAVILSALLFGALPGLLAVALSALASTYLPAPGSNGHAVLLFGASGLLVVATCSAMLSAYRAQNISLQQNEQLNASLRSSEARFRELIETAPDAMIIADRRERIVLVNAEAERLFGYSRAELIGEPISTLMPTRFRDQHQGRITAFLDHPHPQQMGYGMKLYGLRKDGAQFPIETNLNLLPDSGEGLVSSVIRDMSARQEADERQALMIRELNHRVKNTLANVQAIVSQTLKSAETPAAFDDALTARLSALSQSHDVLTRNDWSGAQVREIVAEQLSPYGEAAGGLVDARLRFKLAGPDVKLGPNRAVTLGMALGELATNAAKYGSLSNGGFVEVHWTRTDQQGTSTLLMEWRERGGPAVAEPARRGFGMRLIERSLEAGLGGSADVRFEAEGVVCQFVIPLAANEA